MFEARIHPCPPALTDGLLLLAGPALTLASVGASPGSGTCDCTTIQDAIDAGADEQGRGDPLFPNRFES
jgi:hypothetical protein